MGDTKPWESRISSAIAVHPDAPIGGGGPGFFRLPRLLDASPTDLPHPGSRAGRRMDAQEIQAAHDRTRASSWVESLLGADHWMELQQAAEVVLGPSSFGLGVCVGIVKNPLSAVAGLIDLEKTFILADLHDRIHRPLSWRTFLGVGLAAELGAELLLQLGVLTEHDLDEAVRHRDGTIRELHDIFKDPVKFLAGIPGKIKDDYVAKWNRFTALNAQVDLESQFEAGMIFGDVLMDVAMTIATVVSGVGAAVRVASKVPELMRVVGILREARLPAVGVAAAADAEEAVAAAKMAGEPRMPPEPRAGPATAGESSTPAAAGEPPSKSRGWKGEGRLELSAEQNAKADQFLSRAATSEQSISPKMIQIRDTIPSAQTPGYPDYVLKSSDSFKRKLATALSDNPNLTVDDALATMKDSVRYTIQVPTSDYTSGVTNAVTQMQGAGFEPVKFKNLWGDEGYKGINSFWKDPETGHIFEVQFHTPESFGAKMDAHGLYEEMRLPTTSPERAAELQAQMNKGFADVPAPEGAQDIAPTGDSR
jgi:hypothetical protein